MLRRFVWESEALSAFCPRFENLPEIYTHCFVSNSTALLSVSCSEKHPQLPATKSDVRNKKNVSL